MSVAILKLHAICSTPIERDNFLPGYVMIHKQLAVTAVAGTLFGFALCTFIGRTTSPTPSTPIKLRDYCAAVHVALGMDADDFASGNDQRRAAAILRFGDLFTYHSDQEIQLCAKVPPDLTARGACALSLDYACLAKLARIASESVKP